MSQRVIWIERHRRIERRQRTRPIIFVHKKRKAATKMSPGVIWIERHRRIERRKRTGPDHL